MKRCLLISLAACASVACAKLETNPNGMGGSAADNAAQSGGAGGASGSGVLAGESGAGGMPSVAGSSGGSAGMLGDAGSAGVMSSGGSSGSSSGGSGGSIATGGVGGIGGGGSGGGSAGCGSGMHSCYVAASNTYECFHYQDVATCGTRCEPCPAPAQGGEATCSINGECGVRCDEGFRQCTEDATYCARLRWDFEDETTQGFAIESHAFGAVTGPIASLAPSTVYEGSRALRIPFTSSDSGREIYMFQYLCSTGYVDVDYRTLSVAVRFEELSSSGTGNYQANLVIGTNAGGTNSESQSYEPNTWYVMTGETGSAGSETFGIGFSAYISRDATGYLWIDAITIE